MSGRREVNVDRLEHSWIPFYRELAEKLVDDGWRERQGELVGMLKEMEVEGLRMPPLVRKLDEDIDPITVLAMFNRNLNWNDNLKIIESLGNRFDIAADSPEEDPFVPKSNRYVIGAARDAEPIWDILTKATETDPVDRKTNLNELITLFELCLKNIGISKLTAGLYWVAPEHFLHIDTIDGFTASASDAKVSDGKSYFEGLRACNKMTSQSFPEVNLRVFKSQNPSWDPPKVWIVRGGRDAVAVEEFLTGGFTGFGFDFGDCDVSGFRTVDELERFGEERSLKNDGIGQVIRFLTEIKIGDYVLMPGPGSVISHYGRVASDPYHDRNGSHNNRREVEWSDAKISRMQLDLSSYQPTVTLPNQEVRNRFFEIINGGGETAESKLPEDGWVPFHREVADATRVAESIGRIEQLETPEVWIGIAQETEFDVFMSENRFGLKLGLDEYDLSGLTVKESIAQVFHTKRTDLTEATARVYLPWWARFLTEIQIGDYILMPSHDQSNVYFGEVMTRPSYEPERDVRNSRNVSWHSTPIPVGLLESFPFQDRPSLAERVLVPDPELVESFFRVKQEFETNRVEIANYTTGHMIADGVFLERSEIERMMRILRSKRNLIVQGPPGVGKTFIARKLAYVLMESRAENRITSVQFHQSYAYEDFVGGFRPEVRGERMVFTRQDGPFLKVCKEARGNPDDAYVVLIDEINRGNLSRVFGELLMLIEADKRKSEFGVTLQHRPDAEEGFFVPENVYIIGTMNLADRSLTGMNVAMRRRFGFVDLEPQFKKSVFTNWLRDETRMPTDMQSRINTKMAALNSTIAR